MGVTFHEWIIVGHILFCLVTKVLRTKTMLVMFALWLQADEDRRVRMAQKACMLCLLIRRWVERQRLIVIAAVALYLELSKQASEYLDEINGSSNGLLGRLFSVVTVLCGIG